MNKYRWENLFDAGDELESALKEWSKLIEECKRRAQGDMCLLNEQMLTLGWSTKNILLSSQEQIRFSFVDD